MKKSIKRILAIVLCVLTVASCMSALSMVSFASAATKKSEYVLSKSVTKRDNEVVKKTSYKYDKQNRLAKITFEGEVADEKGDPGYSSLTAAFSYSKDGNLSKKVISFGDGDKYTYTYSYNSKGNLSKEVNNASSETTVYTYDSKGNCTKKVSKDNSNEQYTTTYTYNSKGFLIKEVYKAGSYVTTTINYTYDSKGNCTKKVSKTDYDGEGSSTSTYTYTYDSKGNLVKEVENYKSWYSQTYTTTYTYNSKGNLVKKVVKEDDSSRTSKYTYDSKGNLTKEEYIYKGYYTEKEITTYSYQKVTANQYVNSNYVFSYNKNVALNGKKACPVINIRMGKSFSVENHGEDFVLIPGKDYKVTYKNNTKPGNASAVITFVGDYVNEGTVTLPFTVVKPSTPKVTGLKTTKITGTTLTFSWSKVVGAKYYTIEKSTDGKKWTKVATTDKTFYKVSNLKTGTKYQFRATALNSNKKAIGKASSVLKTQTLCAAPTIKLSSAKSKTVTVTWSKLHGASKYAVKYSTDNKTWKTAGLPTGTSFTIKSLTDGKKVYVKVYAINSNNLYSAASQIKSVSVKK